MTIDRKTMMDLITSDVGSAVYADRRAAGRGLLCKVPEQEIDLILHPSGAKADTFTPAELDRRLAPSCSSERRQPVKRRRPQQKGASRAAPTSGGRVHHHCPLKYLSRRGHRMVAMSDGATECAAVEARRSPQAKGGGAGTRNRT